MKLFDGLFKSSNDLVEIVKNKEIQFHKQK